MSRAARVFRHSLGNRSLQRDDIDGLRARVGFVNNVSTALHLRYDIRASPPPADVNGRLLQSGDQCITADGVIVLTDRPLRADRRPFDLVGVARIPSTGRGQTPVWPDANGENNVDFEFLREANRGVA